MFAKVVVKGKGQGDLYKFLTGKKTNAKFAGPISWNFEKFLVDRRGRVVSRHKPGEKPLSKRVVANIEKLLAQK